jgi:hypothetical protein
VLRWGESAAMRRLLPRQPGFLLPIKLGSEGRHHHPLGSDRQPPRGRDVRYPEDPESDYAVSDFERIVAEKGGLLLVEERRLAHESLRRHDVEPLSVGERINAPMSSRSCRRRGGVAATNRAGWRFV